MVMKTPGVYIVEKSAFPNSVVQVATAVPAFIGYTEMAMNGNVSLHETPMKITSISEFHSYFGGAPDPMFKLQPFEERISAQPYGDDADMAVAAELPQAVFTTNGPAGTEKFELIQTNTAYTLYSAMRAFFLNGGGTCYVTSIGSYSDPIDAAAMLKAIKGLEKEPEPTMLVIPETTRLNRQNSLKVQQQMLAHCGLTMKNRFAILDIHGGYLDERSPRGDPIASFRNDAGANYLDYGAAYYPWLDSAVYQSRDFTFENIELGSRNKFISLLKRSVGMDKALVPEILKIGTAEVSGDFTISVASGGVSVLKASDIHAADDLADTGELQYVIDGEPTALQAQMKGKLVSGAKNASADTLRKADAIFTFTQKDIDDGKIRFVHEVTDGQKGSFELVITDNEGVKTSARKIVVAPGSDVIALPDVIKQKPVKVSVAEDGATIDGVVLLGADAIDEVAVKNADDGVQTARKALADADEGADTAPLQQAVTDAEEAAVAKVKDQTVTRKGVGTWTVDGSSVVFAPNSDFRGSETTVRYKLIVGGELSEAREIKVLVDGITEDSAPPDPMTGTIDKTMRATVPLYTDVMNAITKYMNVMPPAAAMAGVYTAVDNTRGVWKAPANVSVAGVTGPMVNIDHGQQENLNVSTTGKSINAIRPFVGEGTLVWGARTLDGNSLDWRYINVRRTMIMIEESIRLAAKAYVFEPNTANTWVTIRSMIENFLTSVWKAGGLAGAVPTDAFSVHVGLGETMTPVDILEGKLLVTVLVAVSRPAEFIEITFQQQMQKS
ncbi:phage tail sheath C-terminal domain-containing protein [Roseobacter weihaiensis]|uniref:phage tail sheath C-terminal domain-containing protein n=1 Tax=Roseobacter weihaiensis TaxID=2763262 RepID=UPI001D0B1BD0|nr:phage tail sheath C-terminal domain-containing protein [Roseobacter sp. H9]